MKLPVILLTLLFLGTALGDESTDNENAALIRAVTSYNWSWETTFSDKWTFTDIQFYQGGFAQNPKFFTARWEVTGPRTMRLINTKPGASNEGKVAYVVFDADFTRYIGIHFDGIAVVKGARRESLDPNRPSPASESK